jgi:hypothetical protein
MAINKEYQFRKLNDLLSTSFNNVKFDVRDLNAKMEHLGTNFASFSTESIKTAFDAQTSLILEQQKAINQLGERIQELETRKPEVIVQQAPIVQPTSTVFKTKDSALAEVRRFLKSEDKAKDEKSIYDIPTGEVKITRLQLKSKFNGKRDLNGEWVEVTGYGVEMTGFVLQTKNKKNTFKFPQGFTIYGPTKIFTGRGKNTNTKLFWNKSRPVWKDSGDVATLKNRMGKIVSQVMSEQTYSFKTIK